MSDEKPKKFNSKGIHDPWRMGSSDWKPPENEKPVGATGSEHPLDWDLIPHKEFMLRFGHAPPLLIHGAGTAEGAAARFMHGLQHMPKLQEVLEAEGFQHGPQDQVAARGFVFKSKSYVLFHPDHDAANGWMLLVRTLLSHNRYTPGFKADLEKAGIFPLLV